VKLDLEATLRRARPPDAWCGPRGDASRAGCSPARR